MSIKVLAVSDFPPLGGGSAWGSPVEVERRLRITLSVATYAYEITDSPLLDDFLWDRMACRINRDIDTGHPVLDQFFATEFSPMTGMWIHNHPELDKVKATHDRYRNVMGHSWRVKAERLLE